MGYYEDTGILILGTRFRRLSERFLSEISKIYKNLNIDFEPSWFPVFFLLHRKKSLSITEISEKLNVSQPAASQLVSILISKGFLSLNIDKYDKRRKIVYFTNKGNEFLKTLIPIWETMENCLFEIFNEDENYHLVESFNELERKLNGYNLCDSVLDKLTDDNYGNPIDSPMSLLGV